MSQTSPTDLRALATKATPGPWKAFNADYQRLHDDDLLPIFVIGPEEFHTIAQVRPGNSDDDLPAQTEANARWMAACDPQTITALLDERDTLRAALEKFAEWPEPPSEMAHQTVSMDVRRAARAALTPKEPGV